MRRALKIAPDHMSGSGIRSLVADPKLDSHSARLEGTDVQSIELHLGQSSSGSVARLAVSRVDGCENVALLYLPDRTSHSLALRLLPAVGEDPTSCRSRVRPPDTVTQGAPSPGAPSVSRSGRSSTATTLSTWPASCSASRPVPPWGRDRGAAFSSRPRSTGGVGPSVHNDRDIGRRH